MTPPRVAVVQDGARLNYALPVALQRAGLLERVFAEWAAPPGSAEGVLARAVGRVAPGAGRRSAARWHPELDPARVERNPLLAARLRLARRRFDSDEAYFAHCSERVARWVLRRGWGAAGAVYGFVRNAHPRVFEAARAAGLAAVGDQMIAPAAAERRRLLAEVGRWPGWHRGGTGKALGLVDEVERRTWAALDRITCASEFVRGELLAAGVSADRVCVVPYPVPAAPGAAARRPPPAGPLTVGFVGGVGLRKGAPYFAQVARRVAGGGLRFVMVGPVGLTPAGERDLREAGVELVGPVPRAEVAGWLDRFDVFLFPSTCEGSASAVMEAMAAGLPVVVSPESGSIAADGRTGFVRRFDDVDGQAEAVGRLAADPGLRAEMGAAARAAAAAHDLTSYSAQLVALLGNINHPT